jgi:lysine 2,3-aminomutase
MYSSKLSLIINNSIQQEDNVQTFKGEIPRAEWNDWHWQQRNFISNLDDLRSYLNLSEEFVHETLGKQPDKDFFMKITPHFIEHLRHLRTQYGLQKIRPLLATLLPVAAEDGTVSTQLDGMGEDGTGAHQLISNLYEDRGLLFITNHCPVHCRYCFRRRKINDEGHKVLKDDVYAAIDKIKLNKQIRDVVISGGDPLSLSDERLDTILEMIYKIDHVQIVRIDTKFPSVLPQRFTANLLHILSKRKPLYMTFHFVHPDEISPETEDVCNRLADSGIILSSYIPLLKGINNNRETLKELFLKLVEMRVRPYYLVQNVTNKWNKHFQVPIEEGLKLIDGLHGEISGLALPSYVVYLPEAGGKVPLQNDYLVKQTSEGWIIRNFQGREILYREQI